MYPRLVQNLISFIHSPGPPTLLGSPLAYMAHLCTPLTEEEEKGMLRSVDIQSTGTPSLYLRYIRY